VTGGSSHRNAERRPSRRQDFARVSLPAFLGTQGDNRDTQSDMFCALIGASAALIFLQIPHDRAMGKLP